MPSDSTTVRIAGATDVLLKSLAAELGQRETEVADRAIYALYALFHRYGPVPGLHVGAPESPTLDRQWLLDQVDRRVAFLKGDDHAA